MFRGLALAVATFWRRHLASPRVMIRKANPCQAVVDGTPCGRAGTRSVELFGRPAWFCDRHLIEAEDERRIAKGWQQFRDGDIYEINP